MWHVVIMFCILFMQFSPQAIAGEHRKSRFKADASMQAFQGLSVQKVRLELKISDDLIQRATNLPKKNGGHASARGLNKGFSGNGFYGSKDIEELRLYVQEKMRTSLQKYSILVDSDADFILVVTLLDARPNRPTFLQLSKEPGLAFSSTSLGGASFDAVLMHENKKGRFSYGWYESDIRRVQGHSTWFDAHFASKRFARKTAKYLDKLG